MADKKSSDPFALWQQMIGEMEKGQKLQLEVVDSSVLSFSTTLPLGEFASVRQGAPARTFAQEIDE